MKVKRFEDLKVWKISHELVLEIYIITRGFPKEELYGLATQLRRAAASVPSNIVEGYYRHTTKELIKFLYNARGSAGEVAYFLILSNDLEYISKKEYEELRKRYEALLRSISAMINSLSKK